MLLFDVELQTPQAKLLDGTNCIVLEAKQGTLFQSLPKYDHTRHFGDQLVLQQFEHCH
jgi:hypothetical protein